MVETQQVQQPFRIKRNVKKKSEGFSIDVTTHKWRNNAKKAE